MALLSPKQEPAEISAAASTTTALNGLCTVPPSRSADTVAPTYTYTLASTPASAAGRLNLSLEQEARAAGLEVETFPARVESGKIVPCKARDLPKLTLPVCRRHEVNKCLVVKSADCSTDAPVDVVRDGTLRTGMMRALTLALRRRNPARVLVVGWDRELLAELHATLNRSLGTGKYHLHSSRDKDKRLDVYDHLVIDYKSLPRLCRGNNSNKRKGCGGEPAEGGTEYARYNVVVLTGAEYLPCVYNGLHVPAGRVSAGRVSADGVSAGRVSAGGVSAGGVSAGGVHVDAGATEARAAVYRSLLFSRGTVVVAVGAHVSAQTLGHFCSHVGPSNVRLVINSMPFVPAARLWQSERNQ